MGELTAITRRLDGDVDLLAAAGPDGVLFERGRAGLAGRGTALRVAVADVDDALAGIAVDDEVGLPGCGPVAFGALPFLRSTWAGATMVVPEVVWGRGEDGTRWVTTIGAADVEVPAPIPVPSHRNAAPGAVRVEPTRPAGAWCDLVAAATDAIRRSKGRLEKVVLAREVVVEADAPFDRSMVLARLRASYPGCFVTHVDGFVGASPELLVGRSGDVVRAQPMAGTAPRGGDPASDARLAASLLSSPTYRHEHQVTIDDVHDTLLAWCSYVDFEPEPSVVAVANVQHLATLVEGRLSRPAPSVLELVRALHPTPAVNGRREELATKWIVEHEGFDRGRYGGTVGWVDSNGNGRRKHG